MLFSQPLLHHILYVESEAIQIARHGFLKIEPKSIWLELENQAERTKIEKRLQALHRSGKIKLYVISGCEHGDETDVDGLYEELDTLEFAG